MAAKKGPGESVHRSTEWRRKNPEKRAASEKRWKDDGRAQSRQLKYRYGITKEQYDAQLVAQGGVCPICALAGTVKPDEKDFCLDHNHKTGKPRALICRPHNFLLGLAHDNPAELAAAYHYLKHYEVI